MNVKKNGGMKTGEGAGGNESKCDQKKYVRDWGTSEGQEGQVEQEPLIEMMSAPVSLCYSIQ